MEYRLKVIWILSLVELIRAYKPILYAAVSSEEERDSNVDSFINNLICCQRQAKLINIGHDNDLKPVRLDVGKCKKSCHDSKTFDSQMISQKCPPSFKCRATLTSVYRSFLKDGAREVDVVESCGCTEIPKSCERQENWKIFYKGTVYQSSLDVGRCDGNCDSGKNCVEVINSCSCVEACYRKSKMAVFRHIVRNETTGSEREQTKEIDVGECAGTCPNHSGYKCVMRSKTHPSVCLMSLKKRRSSCLAVSHTTHRLAHSIDGQHNQVILSVSRCGCQ
ncbi:uncharacterized protein LOC141903500 [Tubulanus polymorphus]|uniref:uncharacterized protein LOC141903500 n=1 Tax=Tubulanus polymorphus TaxID=672921 RepID=UPI003DA1E55A